MKNPKHIVPFLMNLLRSNKARLWLLMTTIILFLLAAGAPGAPGGPGN